MHRGAALSMAATWTRAYPGRFPWTPASRMRPVALARRALAATVVCALSGGSSVGAAGASGLLVPLPVERCACTHGGARRFRASAKGRRRQHARARGTSGPRAERRSSRHGSASRLRVLRPARTPTAVVSRVGSRVGGSEAELRIRAASGRNSGGRAGAYGGVRVRAEAATRGASGPRRPGGRWWHAQPLRAAVVGLGQIRRVSGPTAQTVAAALQGRTPTGGSPTCSAPGRNSGTRLAARTGIRQPLHNG